MLQGLGRLKPSMYAINYYCRLALTGLVVFLFFLKLCTWLKHLYCGFCKGARVPLAVSMQLSPLPCYSARFICLSKAPGK